MATIHATPTLQMSMNKQEDRVIQKKRGLQIDAEKEIGMIAPQK